MAGGKRETDELARELFGAVKLIAEGFERGSTDVLADVHSRLGAYFMEVTEPYGRRDNEIEQRLIGAMWAELEEVLDGRRNGRG
jgi:hypothetical protein